MKYPVLNAIKAENGIQHRKFDKTFQYNAKNIEN